MSRRILLVGLLVAGSVPLTGTEPNEATRRWWRHVVALSDDSLQGRDTGSEGHRTAARYVARELERYGVRAAGEQGFFQRVPLRLLTLARNRSRVTLTRNGRSRELAWLRQITTAARRSPIAVSGRLVFIGSDNGAALDTAGAVVVRLNPERLVAGIPEPPPPPADAAAVIGIDSTRGPEPQRWPAQNLLAMRLADAPAPDPGPPVVFRFNPAEAELLFEASGHSYKEVLSLFSQRQPVPSFPLAGTLAVRAEFDDAALESENVIGVLPGSDPMLANQHVVVSAHLDGYGLGEPWGRDRIYNGAFDNAAYVATLLEYAERLRESGTALRRSLLFAIVTGEEKGLLGSRYYTQHLTVPRESLVANVNLDQLRPVFPLHTLTMHGIDDTTLGDIARGIAAAMDIRLQADPEPLRNLLRRTDHWSFMQIGVPATGFVFGFQPGTPDEVAYRRWYANRYHTPLDDVSQPWVPEAAARFNDFFMRLVTAIANADQAPAWKAGSALAPPRGN
jgi:hypothetical protein